MTVTASISSVPSPTATSTLRTAAASPEEEDIETTGGLRHAPPLLLLRWRRGRPIGPRALPPRARAWKALVGASNMRRRRKSSRLGKQQRQAAASSVFLLEALLVVGCRGRKSRADDHSPGGQSKPTTDSSSITHDQHTVWAHDTLSHNECARWWTCTHPAANPSSPAAPQASRRPGAAYRQMIAELDTTILSQNRVKRPRVGGIVHDEATLLAIWSGHAAFPGLKPASASFFTNNLTKATSRPLAMHPRVVSAGLYTCPPS